MPVAIDDGLKQIKLVAGECNHRQFDSPTGLNLTHYDPSGPTSAIWSTASAVAGIGASIGAPR